MTNLGVIKNKNSMVAMPELTCFRNPVFLRSTWDAKEVAAAKIVVFAGRSNAGKSSVLNALCGGRFARTARKPGRTRMINLFALKNDRVFADLPGYGYAAGSRSEQKEWGGKLTAFMHDPAIAGAVLVVDCRRGIGERDILFLQLCAGASLILMNKSDKLSRSAMSLCLQKAGKQLNTLSPQSILLPFSVLKKQGTAEAQHIIQSFWDDAPEPPPDDTRNDTENEEGNEGENEADLTD